MNKISFKDFEDFREWAISNGFQELQTAEEFKTHGGAGTRVYIVWRNMKKRFPRHVWGMQLPFKDYIEFEVWALATSPSCIENSEWSEVHIENKGGR